MGNFDFLSDVDLELFKIIKDAEKLYQDEYFEQCITQLRRFAENVCKKVLGNARTIEVTFDDMLATLKDKSSGSESEKEFIDDLYYIKKQGNNAVHSMSVSTPASEALECMKRSFEVSINYAVFYRKSSKSLMKLQFDTELLITGKRSKKTLAEKYNEEKKNNAKFNKKQTTKKTTGTVKQSHTMKTRTKKKQPAITAYWFFVLLSFIPALIIALILFYGSK